MNEQMQAMAFMAGANSIFYCDKLLTTPNPKANSDMQLFERLGIKPEEYQVDKEQSRAGSRSSSGRLPKRKPIYCFIEPG